MNILYEDDDFVAIDKPFNLTVNRAHTTRASQTLQDHIDADISPFKDLDIAAEVAKLEETEELERELEEELLAELEVEQEADSNAAVDQKSSEEIDPNAEADSTETADSEAKPPAKSKQFKSSYKDFLKRSGLVHRIDKDTSGVILVAKTYDAFLALQKQFFDRVVKKEYTAITFDHMKDAIVGDKITVNAPIGRNPSNREKFAVVADGREAETQILVAEIFDIEKGKFTLVKCFPKTGRTHQIRVHLTAMQIPVAGDLAYGGRTRSKKYKDEFPRQMLHATQIEFNHPTTNKRQVISSDLPSDMQNVLELLRKNSL